MNVVDSVSNVWDRLPKFKNIKNKFREMSLDLEQNKIDINENDALADKTFFAFLADLLRCFKKDDQYSLLHSHLQRILHHQNPMFISYQWVLLRFLRANVKRIIVANNP